METTMPMILKYNFILIFALMFGLWLLSLVKKDASIADIFWGVGFILIAWFTFMLAEGYQWRKLLIVSLTTIWGLRLAIHILVRNWGKGEDPRYRAMRVKHGKKFPLVGLFTVFGLQAILLWIISLVLQIGQISSVPNRLIWLDGLGALLWTIGFLFESVGDWQLMRFKANPLNKGKVMKKGLWAYTRHPNYFGESLIWWGLFLIASATPHGLWTVISPIVITFLLLKVSGVTLLEKTILETRPEYLDYITTTNAFIPWFPKEKKNEYPD